MSIQRFEGAGACSLDHPEADAAVRQLQECRLIADRYLCVAYVRKVFGRV